MIIKKDKITEEKLGIFLFEFCSQRVSSFMKSLDKLTTKFPKSAEVKKSDINEIELLISMMWTIFDLLQNKKYEKALNVMHRVYMKSLGLSEEESDEELKHLSIRYDEYHKAKINDSKKKKVIIPDYTDVIAKNILTKDNVANINTNLFFQFVITINLQQTVLDIGKFLKEIEIIK